LSNIERTRHETELLLYSQTAASATNRAEVAYCHPVIKSQSVVKNDSDAVCQSSMRLSEDGLT